MMLAYLRSTLLGGMFGVVLTTCFSGRSVVAQQPALRRANTANWALAERFSTEVLRPLIFPEAVKRTNADGSVRRTHPGTGAVTPEWIGESDSFWYARRDPQGTRYMLVVPHTKTKRPLFDHRKLAAALSEAAQRPFDRRRRHVPTPRKH